MSTSTKWIIGILAFIGVLTAGAVIAIASLIPITRDPSPAPPPTVVEEPAPPVVPAPPVEEPALPVVPTPPVEKPAPVEASDGEWFGFVTVDGDHGPTVLTIDVAEILTGDAARRAAVDAGVIEEGEDVPNDFFITNPDRTVVSLTLDAEASIRVLSGQTPDTYLTIDATTLEALFNGSYSGTPVYGIMADTPAPMTITVEDGVVTAIESVYLP